MSANNATHEPLDEILQEYSFDTLAVHSGAHHTSYMGAVIEPVCEIQT